MKEPLSERTALENLLEEDISPVEQIKDLSWAMLSMVFLLRYEPESLTEVISSYESLYLLRSLVLNQYI